jgi:hypothetical protein
LLRAGSGRIKHFILSVMILRISQTGTGKKLSVSLACLAVASAEAGVMLAMPRRSLESEGGWLRSIALWHEMPLLLFYSSDLLDSWFSFMD